MKILFICAGNICRSVIAECVARERAREMLGGRAGVFSFESSGISAENDSAPHPECMRALELLGMSAVDSTSSITDSEHMERADIAVTMTRQQCYVLAGRFAENRRKCFSLLDLNGALETLLDWRGADLGAAGSALAMPAEELEDALGAAADTVRRAPREEMRALAGVPLTIRELMTLFSPCFHQVSGVHDPVGGTPEEYECCARLIDTEVTLMLKGLLALAATEANTPSPFRGEGRGGGERLTGV